MTDKENNDRELTGAAILQKEIEAAFALIDQVKDSLAKLEGMPEALTELLEMPDQIGANGKAMEEIKLVIAGLQRKIEAQQAAMEQYEAQQAQITKGLDRLEVNLYNFNKAVGYFAATALDMNPDPPELKKFGESRIDKGAA